MNYVPLWIKTDYSILSSLIKIDNLINKLKTLDISSVAVCDDDLFYAKEFYDACNKNNIKPILGLEIKFNYSILLYAKDYKGYQNLCVINKLKNEKKLTEEVLIKYLNNIIVILPYESKDKYDFYYSYTNDLFIGYSSNEQRGNINGSKVYIKKTLVLDKKDELYLPYVYKIRDIEFNLNDVYLEEEISPEDKKSTIYISEKCNIIIPKQTNLLPVYNDDSSFDSYKYLTDLCIVGLKKRLNNMVSNKYIDRLKYELNIINKMGFNNYFLVVWDYVKYAKKSDILVGPGRGSAASSLVSYSLGITDIDPLKYNLLFERFLNPQRVTMPDIDIDFDANKRQLVIDYVTNKYGNNKVAGIITFSNLTSKQVIRDVSKIFELSTYKIDNLLKNFDDKETLSQAKQNTNVQKILSTDKDIEKMYDVCLHLEGLKRHTSVHAAGIVISSKELYNYVPLAVNQDGSYLCGYTMNYIEDLGLLKMDFLGLKNLTLIDNIIKSTPIKFNEIPLDDKKTFELFLSGNLDGVFQFETLGMRRFVEELKPTSIDDLIAAVALFRPGPIDNIPHYIARRNGKEKITYIHPDLELILKSTYGIIIYQEQIMQIASLMAGFSYGQADILRRAMSKKKESVLIDMKDKFIQGSILKGYTKETANEVYGLILKFANYGFNKAHSVSYAIIGYKIAYLKAHYPLIFMREILNNYIGVIGKTKSAINECKKLGLEIIKPSINTSNYEYKINDNKLEYSLAMIKGIGTLTCKSIIDDRNKNGLFKSYLDFVKRTYKQGKDVIKNLILSGALDEFGNTKRTLVENMDEALNYAFLATDLDDGIVAKPELKIYEEYSKEELTSFEEKLYGFYISNHPTSKYVSQDSITLKSIDKYFDKNIKIVLLFERKTDIDTKNKEKMMFITASDLYGQIELVMFPKQYNKYFNIIIPAVYEVNAKVEKRYSKIQLVINELKKL